MYDGSWLAAGGLRYYECLDVEAPQKTPVTPPQSTGLDVALIPSQAKRRIGKIRVYDEAGNVIETREHAGEFCEF